MHYNEMKLDCDINFSPNYEFHIQGEALVSTCQNQSALKLHKQTNKQNQSTLNLHKQTIKQNQSALNLHKQTDKQNQSAVLLNNAQWTRIDYDWTKLISLTIWHFLFFISFFC